MIKTHPLCQYIEASGSIRPGQVIISNFNISYLAIFSVGTYLPSSPFELCFSSVYIFVYH